jgi:hypothetical protein
MLFSGPDTEIFMVLQNILTDGKLRYECSYSNSCDTKRLSIMWMPRADELLFLEMAYTSRTLYWEIVIVAQKVAVRPKDMCLGAVDVVCNYIIDIAADMS